MSVVRSRSGAGRLLRLSLLGSVAGLCLTSAPAVAAAQDLGPPSGVATPQIVISGPGTPTTARDPVNVTGVGQMIIDEQNGFIGLCTASLINPRTVILAAHCVNERAANAYGAGGFQIGFGFSNNNNTAGASAFGGWLGNHQTNASLFMYNSNYVAYNPGSLEPAAQSFLYSDVAVASLDTVAKGIPTWSMLFSALPATPITANGTGYHVTIDGYGNNGTGTTGSTGGIDFRRRLAENMLGALSSIDKFENFLFGGNSTSLPQNLYWIDFDDPRRGTASASPFDFNAWRDNALPKEGITASGDSGGPLILDNTFAKPVVLGVLSGGYDRFFNGQPSNGYGTASFYQPLYLYWDWIAANNPYHYVSAIAGDANWNDASHWVTNLDPNYQIIGPNGQLVNGVPTSPGEGKTGGTGAFGQACFQSGGVSDCLDVSTGTETIVAKPIGTGASIGASNGAAIVSADALLNPSSDDTPTEGGDGTRYGFNDLDAVRVAADAQTGTLGDVTASALPPATLLNGLPGASNFTPNNTNGNRLTTTPPRYFDVTLSANGRTTLDTSVTVDRLTLAGAGAGLTITSTGSLISNIDITQLIGTLQVDGALRTPGDFFIMAGGLSGQGVITTPFFTNMAGVIAPGTPTTIGTLTFNGNVILASGGSLLINLGASGASDRIAVAATQFSGGAPVDGRANVGGLVAFGFVSGATPHFGDIYTFLTAEGGVTGTFQAANISAILRPALLYGPTSVRVQIAAGLYGDVATGSPAQRAFAQLLDQNRGQYAQFSDLYGPLDLQNQATIQATLDGMAPATETLKTALGTASLDSISSFYRGRLSEANGGEMGGTLELIGRPIEFAAASLDPLGGGPSLAGDGEAPVVVPHALPENMRGYVAAGYLNGQSAQMTGTPATGKDDFNGYFLAAGVETALDDRRMVGVSLSATDLSGDTTGLPQTSDGRLYQVAVYGRHELEDGYHISGQFSAGRLDVETTRVAVVGPSVFTLHTKDEANAFAGEVGVGYTAVGDSVTVTPAGSFRVSRIDYGPTTETGGGPALQFQRDAANSIEGRLGVSVTANAAKFRPYFDAAYVHAFRDQATTFGANLVGGVGPNAIFALGGDDHDWAELGFGVSGTGENYRFTVAAETTVGRSDVENQTYRASVGFRF